MVQTPNIWQYFRAQKVKWYASTYSNNIKKIYSMMVIQYAMNEYIDKISDWVSEK